MLSCSELCDPCPTCSSLATSTLVCGVQCVYARVQGMLCPEPTYVLYFEMKGEEAGALTMVVTALHMQNQNEGGGGFPLATPFYSCWEQACRYLLTHPEVCTFTARVLCFTSGMLYFYCRDVVHKNYSVQAPMKVTVSWLP